MHSFRQHSTNESFAQMLHVEKQQRPPSMISEAVNSSFDKIIQAKLSPTEMKVHGNYKLLSKSFVLKIDRRDQEAFKKLFKEAPDKTVGNGEISLYWLFNGSGRKRAYETRGGNDPDLMIDRKAVEVKAYTNHDKFSLGRFQDRRVFRSMVNTLFGIANLAVAFEGGTGRGQQTFKGELSFRYPDLVESAEKFLDLKEIISDNKSLMKFPLFKQMATTIKKFDDGLKAIGFKGRKVNPNIISVALMKHLIEISLGEKPGDKGYICNLLPKNPLDIYFHYIDLANMTSDEKILTQPGTFNINGGVFSANFTRLFK